MVVFTLETFDGGDVAEVSISASGKGVPPWSDITILVGPSRVGYSIDSNTSTRGV